MLEANAIRSAVSAQPCDAKTAQTQRLVDYSPKDRPWDTHRAMTDVIAGIYAQSEEFETYAARMDKCSGVLRFGWADDPDTGESRLKLRHAQFCRVRHCNTCAWRRSLMWQARFYEALPAIIEQHPKSRWLFLTLTVRNCDICDLGATLDAMNAGWNRLRLRKEFRPVQGWIRSTEVTRGRDGSAHPHFHCLLMTSPAYFNGRNYVTQNRWAELWQECGRLDYYPVVDVRTVKSKLGVETDPASMLRGAVSETLKYAVKPQDMTAEDGWFLELTRQVHRRRFIATGGALKDVLKTDQESDEDMALLGEQPAAAETPLLAFNWNSPDKHYMRNPKLDKRSD